MITMPNNLSEVEIYTLLVLGPVNTFHLGKSESSFLIDRFFEPR